MKLKIFLLVILLFAFTCQADKIFAGSIEGKVELIKKLPRRAPKRYPDRPGTPGRKLEKVPAAVFVQGKVNGIGVPAQPKDLLMKQKETSFQPSLLFVALGTSVEFLNLDDEFHNVFSYSKTKRFDLGRYPNGESKSVIFDKPGIVKIYCEIHEWMRAAVIVVENPFHSVVSERGNFFLENVPPGNYSIAVWSIDQGSKVVSMEVSPSGQDKIGIELSKKAKPMFKSLVLYVKQVSGNVVIKGKKKSSSK